MTDWLTSTIIAGSFTLLGVMAFTEAKAMDDSTILGVYVADVTLCGIKVDQRLINEALVNVIFNEDLSPSEAKLKGARISVAISGNIRDSGSVEEYCAKRMGR